MRYRRGDDGVVVERVVDPLGLVLKAATWYLIARRDGGMRTYRISRIDELAILDRFERPDDFDLAEYWDRSVAAYAGSLPRFAATVKLRGDGLDRLAQVIGEGQARQALAGAAGPDQDGWLTMSVNLEDIWHAQANVLSLGADAEVVEPADLRERVAAAARDMASIYG